jgi:hypothetical protein
VHTQRLLEGWRTFGGDPRDLTGGSAAPISSRLDRPVSDSEPILRRLRHAHWFWGAGAGHEALGVK